MRDDNLPESLYVEISRRRDTSPGTGIVEAFACCVCTIETVQDSALNVLQFAPLLVPRVERETGRSALIEDQTLSESSNLNCVEGTRLDGRSENVLNDMRAHIDVVESALGFLPYGRCENVFSRR